MSWLPSLFAKAYNFLFVGGVQKPQQLGLNLIAGPGATITSADNLALGATDVTISSSGGGGLSISGTGLVHVTSGTVDSTAINPTALAVAGDVTGTLGTSVVSSVHGATVPVAGALSAGDLLQVSGVSSLSYGALNLAGGHVTGSLPTANQTAQSMGGDISGTTGSATVVHAQGGSVAFAAATTELGLVSGWNMNIGALAGSYGGGSGVIGIKNASTVPTTSVSGGGVLYSSGGNPYWFTGTTATNLLAPTVALPTTQQIAILRWYQANQTGFTVSAGANPFAVCFDGTNVWVANYTDGTATKFIASTGANVGTYTVGTHPQGICFDGTNIWVANKGGNNVTKLLASTGGTVGTYSAGTSPDSICFDGTNIWTANNGGSVSRL